MSRTVAKETHVLKDIWIAYATQLLHDNPEWWGRYAQNTMHFYVYRRVGTKVELVISYPVFRKTMETYLNRAKRSIIQGEALNVLGGVGKICARRVERDFRKKNQRRVDWHKTRQQPMIWSEEKQKMVYKTIIFFTNDDWCRIGWSKNGRVKNETVYEFVPANRNSGGTSGFKLEFTEALKKDPLLKYKYLFNPLRA
jgi:hypothetical protein